MSSFSRGTRRLRAGAEPRTHQQGTRHAATQLKWLWARLKQIAAMENLSREELLMKLGAARSKARAAWHLIDVEVAPRCAPGSNR
jgi:hypothetical protein